MATHAPLPCWSDLLAAPVGPVPETAALAAPWLCGPSAIPFWFSRGAWAFAALASALATLLDRPARLWFPAYFCDQSLGPLRASGARVAFYPVDEDLVPDWTACETRAAEAAPDLFCLVHTFGHPADTTAARAFCDAHGARLLEDAAHAMIPAPGIGGAGAATLFCPGKTLAVPAGGLLTIHDPTLAEPLRTAYAMLEDTAPPALPWMVKRGIQKLMPAACLRQRLRRAGPGFDDDPPPGPLPETPALSPLAARLIGYATPRLGAEAHRRRDNARTLAAALAPITGCRPLFDPTTTPAPYRLVLRCADPARAGALFDRWKARGVPVETWPDLPPEVKAAPKAFGAALRLRRTLLLLPVHSARDVAALSRLCV